MKDSNAAASSKGKAVAKDSSSDGKKKFEVKKVRKSTLGAILTMRLTSPPVERRGPLGLGYCRRQLRHLPKPHHGLVYVL